MHNTDEDDKDLREMRLSQDFGAKKLTPQERAIIENRKAELKKKYPHEDWAYLDSYTGAKS